MKGAVGVVPGCPHSRLSHQLESHVSTTPGGMRSLRESCCKQAEREICFGNAAHLTTMQARSRCALHGGPVEDEKKC